MRRANSLDALRGLAIILMVLSSMEAFCILPPWMYHAQVPPPDHVFNPDLPGISWVDLVFPFFIFAMGAAFPFAIGRRMESGQGKGRLALGALLRYIRLTVFAIFIQHFYPSVLGGPDRWLLALAAWGVMFLMFMRLPSAVPKWIGYVLKALGYALAILMSCTVHFASQPNLLESPMEFLSFSNIIILVLANMAFFGELLYIFTKDKAYIRLIVLAALTVLAVLGMVFDESWLRSALDWSPAPWLYNFMFLKYLYIIVPGTIAGDCLKLCTDDNVVLTPAKRWRAVLMVAIPVALIVVNVVCLFGRYLILGAVASFLLCLAGIMAVHRGTSNEELLWRRLFILGSILLALGLALEPLQGGIKKDPSTFSYFFVTGGLASFALIAFHVICDHYKCLRSTAFLRLSGQNPMIAYSSGQLFVLPILALVGLRDPFLSFCSTSPWLGFFLQGLGLTSLVVLVTIFFSKVRLYWRT